MKSELKYIVLILFVLATQLSRAAYPDSIFTAYEDGVFRTYCQTQANVPMKLAKQTVDDFIIDFRNDPELLFEWALKGLGVQNDADKDFILWNITATSYDPQTSLAYMITDISFPGITTIDDIKIDLIVREKQLADGGTHIYVEVRYSNAFFNKACGDFYVYPISDSEVLLTLESKVKYSWFFDVFITLKSYRKMAEFRVAGLLDNFKNEMERRYALHENK